MRLIDADSIPWFVEGVGEIPVITKEEIDQMPTMDAEPVRHEHWEHLKHYPNLLFCSGCGDPQAKDIARFYHYCPTCGARMDKDD